MCVADIMYVGRQRSYKLLAIWNVQVLDTVTIFSYLYFWVTFN